jgi:hypothetical protein
VEVVFEDPVPVRAERLIAQGLGLSRNEVLRRIKCDIALRRPTSAGFTFTVMAGDQRLGYTHQRRHSRPEPIPQ